MKQLLNFVVVGGGPTGVEFCGELSDFIKQDLKRPSLRQTFWTFSEFRKLGTKTYENTPTVS